MDDERKPLLADSPAKVIQNSDSTSSSTSLNLTSVKIPIYGTHPQPTGIVIPSEERITYSWSELNVFANITSPSNSRAFTFFKNKKNQPQKKHILKNVSGVAYPCELLAILGSSGAGKTTLLNALTFQSPSSIAVSGIRCVNGVPVAPKTLTSQSAYVQQDDLFIGNLTVKEHLVFQALLRMDRHISYTQRMRRVEEVILEFGLTKCQNTQIGILAEVLTNPKLMFCDEPTSGLDSFMAFTVIQVLKSMAMAGRTVVCTIHQPSSELYSLFDKLLLMSEGRTAFLGSPEEADIFFKQLEAPCPKNYNPADYFIQLLAIIPEKEESSRQAVNMICDKFERSTIGVKLALEAGSTATDNNYQDVWLNGETTRSPYKASWCAQFRAVLWRSWLSVVKEPLLIKVRFIQTIIMALIIGAIYFGQILDQNGVLNINGVLFMFLTSMTFQNVFAVINVFCTELGVFLREHRNGMYRTDVYFLSKTLAETPLFTFVPIVFITICYFMIGLNTTGPRFFVAVGILILVTHVAISFGYLISCVSSNVSMALSIGPPLMIPFLLFGGFFLNVSSIPVYFKWLSYLSWFRFANEALLINQWKNVTNIECPVLETECPKDGHIVLEIYNFAEANFITDILALVALIFVFRSVAYFALLLKTYQRK